MYIQECQSDKSCMLAAYISMVTNVHVCLNYSDSCLMQAVQCNCGTHVGLGIEDPRTAFATEVDLKGEGGVLHKGRGNP